ncbi:MAG TPA: PIG-L family deacetylase [Acidimicrobiia bacterium]|jgi:LmbE family N-acetylglucosaminyl deacetylase
MATLVTFHAHPDDEAIGVGGTVLRAVAAGHRVVLVVATSGEEGEVEDGFLTSGESLGDRRREETLRAASLLGVARVEFLGYRDSGMMGAESNAHPDAFWQAEVEQAAHRLAAILMEETADVVTFYDANGGYGHPDHIQVHRVGARAAEVAGTPRVYESTINRDRVAALAEAAVAAGLEGWDEDEEGSFDDLGLPEDELTTVVDVSGHVERKRQAMAAHASQIAEGSWWLQLPDDVFRVAFGEEWFARRKPVFEGGDLERSLFADGS